MSTMVISTVYQNCMKNVICRIFRICFLQKFIQWQLFRELKPNFEEEKNYIKKLHLFALCLKQQLQMAITVLNDKFNTLTFNSGTSNICLYTHLPLGTDSKIGFCPFKLLFIIIIVYKNTSVGLNSTSKTKSTRRKMHQKIHPKLTYHLS